VAMPRFSPHRVAARIIVNQLSALSYQFSVKPP
jgi:hypothetical protein